MSHLPVHEPCHFRALALYRHWSCILLEMLHSCECVVSIESTTFIFNTSKGLLLSSQSLIEVLCRPGDQIFGK
jgi:hypothetical protein